MSTVDAVVVGGGHQGLVAALYLARAGWEVELVEGERQIGGATRSGEITEAGLVHDLFATNLNLFMASPVYAELAGDLARAGFRPATSSKPYANVFPGGRSLRVYQDVAVTEKLLGEHNAADLDGWRRLHSMQREFMATLMPLYGSRLPSRAAARLMVRAVRSAGVKRLSAFAELLALSTRELGDRYLDSPEVKALLACWGMHLDFGPDVSFGAMFPFVETFADMENGIAIAQGGAGCLPQALATLFGEAGGRIRTGVPVTKVTTGLDGAADGVVLADGMRIKARRSVVATTTPTALYGELLADAQGVPVRSRERAAKFMYGPGTMMVHLATDGPVPWTAHEDLQDFAYVHIAPYVDDLARTYQQSLAGLLPEKPMLVVGQTSRVDPTRTPDHRQVLWIQVRSVPGRIAGDSLGEITATDWDRAKEPMADRVLDIMEAYAPGISDLVRTRHVMSPADLERDNPNLVGGDSLAGSHHVGQNFLFRPWAGASGYDTAIPRLYLAGASAWPGAGTNALSGYLVAQRLIAGGRSAPRSSSRLRRVRRAMGSRLDPVHR
jgi:phytoene dehydrogenase-like protein